MDKVISTHGSCKVVVANTTHIARIYPFMRKADKIEVACMGNEPCTSLLRALETDDVTLTALDADDVPFAMFGVGQVGDQAYIWCLGTDGVSDNAYDFLKASREWTQRLTKPYGATFNYVHEDNHDALKWLKFCGASFIRKLTFSNQPFFEFIIPSK
jgi:hypothetical protein